MIVFLSDVALEFSLSFGDFVGPFVLRSPLMMGMFALVDMFVLWEEREKGGVESGDGSIVVSVGGEVFPNIGPVFSTPSCAGA